MLFYTFCVDIGRHTRNNLLISLIVLLKSINRKIKKYKLICFTNFEIKKNIPNEFNVEFRKYYDNTVSKIYNDKWKNLSFNKINIYKDLYDEFKKDFIWIDLDTIICHDISYINNLKNVFIENGGICKTENILFKNNNKITIPRNRYIQGNFWKLNIDLYNKLIITFNEIKEKKLILRYDLQDLFSYYIYIKNNGNLIDINILGNNIKETTINGLCVWSKEGNTHATLNGLNNLYIENNKIKSKFYPNKSIHILSLTFFTLMKIINNKKFNRLFIDTLEDVK